MAQQTNWEADKMLDVYIYDYFVKRNLQTTAKAFQAEGKVSSDPVAIDAPGGFLFEWWSVFWDIFIARTNEKHSDVAASYIETQLVKAREQQQQQQQQQPPQQHQIQLQQMMMQRQAQQQQQQQQLQQQNQQQRREGAQASHLLNGAATGLVGGDTLRQSSDTVNALATKIYEEKLKLPPQRDPLDEASMKMQQRYADSAGQLLDPSQSPLLKPTSSGQPAGQVLHGNSANLTSTSQQVQGRNQQLPGPAQSIKSEINPILTPRAVGSDGPLIGIQGVNQAGSNLTLKGFPLTGLEPIRSGLLQQQKSFMHSPQQFQQLQIFTPQQQQQLLLQAQQSMASPTAAGDDSRMRRVLLARNGAFGRDGQRNAVGEVILNVGSPGQSSGMPSSDIDMLIKKKIAQMQQQQQLQQQISGLTPSLQQSAVTSQQSQSSSQLLHQDKTAVGSVPLDGNLPNSFRAGEQVSKNQTARKRKQPVSSSGPANSSGTANTAGPSPSSAPSTPSTHTPGDVMSMPQLQHNGGSSKPLMVFGSDGVGSLTSPAHQLGDMDRYVEDGPMDDNVESFLSHDDMDGRDTMGRCMDVSKGLFAEVGIARASSNKVVCCHFSSDGKLLATGGHDKKAVLWHTDSLKQKSTLEEHSSLITDVRFSPTMPRIATSSFDKTVRVWDADNPGYSLRTFTGHPASVMSLDFHPNKDDLICSCDSDGEIRYWSINNGTGAGVFKGGTTQIRFQPRQGKYLAAASESSVSILDVETVTCRKLLQGHSKNVGSICWDLSGDYLASVSEDSVRVWSFGSGTEGEQIQELSCSGNKYHSCVFHPTYPSMLVIGCYQSLELWDMREKKTMIVMAHEGIIAALAASSVTGLVASASHDKFIKLWK